MSLIKIAEDIATRAADDGRSVERERAAIVDALIWVRGLLRARGHDALIAEMADPTTAARQLRP